MPQPQIKGAKHQLVAISTTRRTRVYNVLEHEMDNLTTWNTISTSLVGIGSFLFSLAVTLWVENQLSPTASPAGEVMLVAGAPLALILAVVCYGLAMLFFRKRGGTLRRIKSESDDGTVADVSGGK